MKKNVLLIFSLLLFSAPSVFAGWPIGKHHYVISPSVSLYTAKNSWDINGNHITNTGQNFSAASLSIFAGYGISRRLDITMGVPVTYINTSYVGSTNNYTSLGDLQLGLSYVLFNFKYANYISLYVGGITPLYTNTDTRYMGIGNSGGNVRLSNSGSLGSKIYYNVDVGFSQYVGTGAPHQYIGDLSLGYSINRWNQIGIAGDAVRSVSADRRSVSNILANRDFDYVRVSASYGHSFTKRINVNMSTFYTVAGRNTGEGLGGTLALLYKLPYR